MNEPTKPQLPDSQRPDGRCAVHPSLTAIATCARCGNFACDSCIGEQANGLCLACRARAGQGGAFAYSREHWTLDGLLSLSLTRFKQHWPPLALLCGGGVMVLYGLTVGAALWIGTFAGASRSSSSDTIWRSVAVQVVTHVLQLCFELSSFGLCLDILEGRPASVWAALARARRLPAALLLTLIVYSPMLGFGGGIALLFWTLGKAMYWLAGLALLLGMPVALYVMLGLAFCQISLVADPALRPLGAVRASWAIARGQRWHVLGVGLVAGILSLLGLLACGVGIAATLPLSFLLYAAFYLALRTPSPPDAGVLGSAQWRV